MVPHSGESCSGLDPDLGRVVEVPNRPLAYLVVRQCDTAEAGPHVGGDDLTIVEADDGDIVGNREPEVADRVVGTHRHPVVATEHGRRRFVE